jgi:hypothetical protein
MKWEAHIKRTRITPVFAVLIHNEVRVLVDFAM